MGLAAVPVPYGVHPGTSLEHNNLLEEEPIGGFTGQPSPRLPIPSPGVGGRHRRCSGATTGQHVLGSTPKGLTQSQHVKQPPTP